VYLQYGLPQFTQSSLLTMAGRYHPSASGLTTACVLALGGELAFLSGYGVGAFLKRRTGVSLAQSLSAPRSEWRLPVVAFALLSLTWTLAATFLGVELVDVRFLLSALLNPVLGLILVYLLSRELGSRLLRALAIAITAMLVLAGFVTSMLESIITPVLILLACEWMWGHRARIGWVVALIIFSVVMNPAKLRFRKEDWRKADPITSWSGIEQRIDKWEESFRQTLSDERALQRVTDANSTRVGALLQLAQVIDWVPARVPYQNGDVITDSLVFLVPRFVWPEKPSISDLVNNRFALAFRVSTRKGLRTTTHGIVPPADGYWDFGVPSAIGYLALTGLLLALVLAPLAREPTRKEQIVALLFCGTHLQVVLPMSMLIPWTTSLVAATWVTFRLLDLVAGAPEGPSASPRPVPESSPA
jgi:hypothetical protein